MASYVALVQLSKAYDQSWYNTINYTRYLKLVILFCHFTDEETEPQGVTWQKSNNNQVAGPRSSLSDPSVIMLSCHKGKGGEGVGDSGKEHSREAVKGGAKNNCEQLPVELQFRVQKAVRGRK